MKSLRLRNLNQELNVDFKHNALQNEMIESEAARMLKTLIEKSPIVISVKLVKTIEIRMKGQWFKYETGKAIVLDVGSNIGLIDGRHVQLNESDYSVVMPN